MKHIKLALLTLLLIAFFSVDIHAEDPIVYDTKPFDLSSEKIPYYNGHDVEAVFQEIKMKIPSDKKEQFETKSSYLARMEKYKIDFIYAFKRGDHSRHFRVDYNPEKEVFNIRVFSFFNDSSPTYMYTLRYGPSINKGSYIATNAFGVQVKVTVSEDSEYGLAIPNIDKKDGWNIKIKSSPEEAKHIMGNFRLLLIGKNDFYKKSFYEEEVHFYEESRGRSTPTLDKPYEITSTDNYLGFKLMEIWLYDYVSGEIYWKYKVRKQ
jgi:hypothetical protein